MVFGSPFSDKYPQSVIESLKNRRKGKDILASYYKFVYSTRLYQHVLKHSHRYWLFGISGGVLSCYFIGSFWDCVWHKMNRGRMFIDLPEDDSKPEED